MTWTVSTVTPSGGDATRIGRVVGKTRGPALLYCHGVGGSETEFGHSNYNNLRDWLHNHGWAYIEANAGGPGWGNDTQRACYRAAVQHLAAEYEITDIVVFGRSMGGVVAPWLYLYDDVIAPLSRGLILCASVQDIMWAHDATFAGSVRSAYGTANRVQTVTATAGRSPLDFPAADFTGKSILFQTGDADDIVDGAQNVLAQQGRIAPYLSVHQADVEAGGDHYTVRTRWEAHATFLNTVAPPPPTPYRMKRRSLVGDDGELYLTHPRKD